jgi:hypothetical protein
VRWNVAVIALVLVSCGKPTGVRCTVQADCQAGLLCLSTGAASADAGTSDTRLCMRPCDYDAGPPDGGPTVDQHLCADGTVCTPLEGHRVCFPGSNHAIRTACTDDSQCEGGTICAPDTQLCTQACTVGYDIPCDTNEVCVDVAGGICRVPAIIAGDGGT